MKNLRENIIKYREISWEKLLRQDLGQYNLKQAEVDFTKIKVYFDKIINYKNFQSLPKHFLQLLNNQLDIFFQFKVSIDKFQNTSEHNEWIIKVKEKELEIWNELKPIIEYINFQENSETKKTEIDPKEIELLKLSFLDDMKQLSQSKTEAEKLLLEISEKNKIITEINNELTTNKERYEEAKELAENWIKMEGRATSITLQNKSEIFENKATKDHTGKQVWLWLLGAAIFAGGGIFYTITLINDDKILSVGAALLRISIVSFSFYLTYLSYQQFNIQRKLYEIYKFKSIALSTMENLVKSFTEISDKQFIVQKAIEIIFTEPSFKEDKISHQRIIDELLDVLKKKI